MSDVHFSRAQLDQLKVCDDRGGWSLDLSGSELVRLPPAVTRMESLTSLDISDNPRLRRLPNDLHALSKLRHLAAVHCGFSKFPPCLRDMANLTTLRLSLNNMTQYPEGLSSLRRLERLELVNCSLVDVPVSVASLTGLRHFDLRCNRLSEKSFPPSFGHLKLDELDVSSNQLTNIPSSILNVSTLTQLRICHCSLVTLPPAIAQLKQLAELRLSHNNLQTIPAELGTLVQLEHLHLDHNRLTRLPRCLTNLTKLLDDEGDGFNVRDNQLMDPPQKICDSGLKAIIGYYKINT